MERISVDKRELEAFICIRGEICTSCNCEIEIGDYLILEGRNKLCSTCADIDYLEFLPSGDAALTRRSKKNSSVVCVVKKHNKSRKRNEVQGCLVESEAVRKAEEENLSDKEIREKRAARDAIRREKIDKEYVETFAVKIREVFPNCPAGLEAQIAEHACLKYSGRVGRTHFAKELSSSAIELAVGAHIRHAETKYDELLTMYNRDSARDLIREQVNDIMSSWKGGK